jgi:hypothetical protein
VIDLLQEEVAVIRAEPKSATLEKARTVAHLAAIPLTAIEEGYLAARIEML